MDAKTLYPNSFGEEYCDVYDYQPIVNAFGNVAIQKSTDDYQGDTWVLYNNDGKLGYLCFSWGSCSGCDALQACDSYADLQELIDRIESSLIWFSDKEEALTYFEKEERRLESSWYYDEFKAFIQEAVTYLKQ